MSILKFLGLEPEQKPVRQTSAETETIRKIIARLDSIEPESARFIAGFAYILSRVARADLTISPEETDAMEAILMERAGLPEEQALIVVQMAKTQAKLFGHTENYLVTREFNKIASHQQKLALIECLYMVSSSDESISTVEDNEIRQVALELKVERDELMAIRSRFREHLAVLKKDDPTDQGS